MGRMKPVLIAYAPVLVACTQPAARSAQTDIIASPFPVETAAVFEAEKARELTHQCSRIAPGPVEGAWAPSSADISALEPALAPLIEAQLENEAATYDEPRWSHGVEYYRQYGGLIIGGRRVIYINGVHKTAIERDPDPEHPLDWRTQAVGICDGGSITFGVEYDPAARSFSNFAFNGALRAAPR